MMQAAMIDFRVIVALMALSIALLLTSCVSVGDNNSNDLPWSAPAGWEHNTLGVPM